jgi:hypothetical protein
MEKSESSEYNFLMQPFGGRFLSSRQKPRLVAVAIALPRTLDLPASMSRAI